MEYDFWLNGGIDHTGLSYLNAALDEHAAAGWQVHSIAQNLAWVLFERAVTSP